MTTATATVPKIEFEAATHTYLVDGEIWPGVTSILRATGLSTDWDRMPRSVREAAERKRSLGQDVHHACTLLDRGDLAWGALDDALFPYVEAWERYTRERAIVKWIAIEEIVYHPTWRYIGTLDRLAVLDTGGTLLPDIKIGDPEDAAGQYQTIGYAMAALQTPAVVERGALSLKTPIVRECVQLKENGTYRIHPYDRDRDDWKVFQAALVVCAAQPRRTS